MNYFCEYVLGWRGPGNMKADKGTITHKILEILAVAKKAKQEGNIVFDDDILGKDYPIEQTEYPAGVSAIGSRVYNYYINHFPAHPWSGKDYDDCQGWAEKALTLSNGMFDPRKRDIVAPELHFDFSIDKPWAKYKFEVGERTLEGVLSLKGTMDLITKVDDGIYEIVDWKTGRRLDWGTGEEKTHAKLQNDPQLRLYHYALLHEFPELEQVIVTIFFINDGGPFTIVYDRSELARTEEMLKEKFETIKATTVPKLKQRDWKCSKLCHQGKTTFVGTTIKPIQEFRRGQVTPYGDFMTKCEQIKFEVARKGIDRVTEEYQAPGHTIDHYTAPGGTE